MATIQNDGLEQQAKFGNPQNELILIGITGTDGKTTTASIVQHLIGKDRCGYIGTNGVSYKDVDYEIPNTTPVPSMLYKILREFADAGLKYAVLELSSEAQHYGRLDGLKCDCIGLTNITSEHLNTHGSLENYIAAKISILRDNLKPNGVRIINEAGRGPAMDCFAANAPRNDAICGSVIASEQGERGNPKTLFYGYGNESDFRIDVTESTSKGSTFFLDPATRSLRSPAQDDFNEEHAGLVERKGNGNSAKRAESETLFSFHWSESDKPARFTIPLIGKYNVENFVCAYLCCAAADALPADASKAMEGFKIPGRMEFLQTAGSPTVLIDYAHTPNGLLNLFETIKTVFDFDNFITVSGQAGSRDRSKRPVVAKIISDYSKHFIITSEDPHWEEVESVISDMVTGIEPKKKLGDDYEIIIDRGDAIKRAFELANRDDLILILGKGRESTHDVKGEAIPFSDFDAAEAILSQRSAK